MKYLFLEGYTNASKPVCTLYLQCISVWMRSISTVHQPHVASAYNIGHCRSRHFINYNSTE